MYMLDPLTAPCVCVCVCVPPPNRRLIPPSSPVSSPSSSRRPMSPVSTKRADKSGTCPRPRALARRRRPRRHAHALLRLHRRHQHSMVDRERVLVVSSSPPADGEGLRHHALARVTRPLGHEGDDPPAAILLGDPTATAAWCIARTEKEDPPVVPCTNVQAAALRIVTQGSRSRGSSRRAPYVSRILTAVLSQRPHRARVVEDP